MRRRSLREQAALVCGEPFRIADAVVEVEQHDDAEQHGRRRLDEEQPLPIVKPAHAAEALHDRAGDRRADDERQWLRGQQQRDGAALPMRRIPVVQVQQHAGKEAGLGRAEQEPQEVEHGVAA